MNYPATSLPKYFYRTAPQPCPYLSGRTERNIFAELSGPDVSAVYDTLARHGFRRSHRIVYRPDCVDCKACVPVRVRVSDFAPSRSLRRVSRANADITADDRAATATREQYQLFSRYLVSRHAGSEMSAMSFEDYRALVEDTAVETRLIEFRDRDGTLHAACLADRLDDGLSAVYGYFEPDSASRGLGTYMVLWLIERCRALELAHAYLGYWIAASRKMSYKARFQPLEALGDDGWRDMKTGG
jgi:arginyl-tRNA--protein-N-Asp/Glu arginylyltransferase